MTSRKIAKYFPYNVNHCRSSVSFKFQHMWCQLEHFRPKLNRFCNNSVSTYKWARDDVTTSGTFSSDAICLHRPLYCTITDSKVHGANMGPTWGRQDPGGTHVGHMNLAIWACTLLPFYEYPPHIVKVIHGDRQSQVRKKMSVKFLLKTLWITNNWEPAVSIEWNILDERWTSSIIV